jgi:3-oxoacyl-[acyl-carrier-protein] synthase II
MDRKVVISGVGVVSPIGIGKKDFWDSAINGRSNINAIHDPDIANLKVTKGCIVNECDLKQHLKTSHTNHYGRGAQLALVAAGLAVDDACLDFDKINPQRIGIAMGTTIGESQSLVNITQNLNSPVKDGMEIARSFTQSLPFNIVTSIAHEYNCQGSLTMIPSACAAGNYAIARGYESIRSGDSDVMLVGGSEPYSKILHIGFARMKVVAPECCQPFDRERKGLLVGEGAAVLVLEEYDRAKKRKASIYGELLGYGLSCDAYHMAAPEPDGRGAAEALRQALTCAKVNPDDIQYISAHGTGTRANDLVETLAIKKVFGSVANKIAISSIKSMIGHTMGASGAIEAVLCALILQHQAIPPTINYYNCDPLCDLDYVPNTARDKTVRKLVSNSYGFFGNNASIVLSCC